MSLSINLSKEEQILAESYAKSHSISIADAFKMVFFDFVKKESADPFYSDANIRYLNKVTSEIDSGVAHLQEHDLIED